VGNALVAGAVVDVGLRLTPARPTQGWASGLSNLVPQPRPLSGSAAPTCGKPPAFRQVLASSRSSALAGRLSLPASAEEAIQGGPPWERRSLSANQAAEPQVLIGRTDRNSDQPESAFAGLKAGARPPTPEVLHG
jgi:hypothetical protein